VKESRKGRKNPNSKPRKPIRVLLHNPNRAQQSTPLLGRIHIYEIAEEILQQHLEGNTTKGVQ
jgi:hypothetical protein